MITVKECKAKICQKRTATATFEATNKKGRPRKRRRDEVEEDLNIMGIKKLAGNGQRPLGMEEDCMGSRGPQPTVMLQLEKRKEVSNLAVLHSNH